MTVPDIVEFVTDTQLLGLTLSEARRRFCGRSTAFPGGSCTGRQDAPGAAFGEVTVIAGARAGKDSRIAAPIVVYEALFGGHQTHLMKGERGIIPLVAQDQRATKIAFDADTGPSTVSAVGRGPRQPRLRPVCPTRLSRNEDNLSHLPRLAVRTA